MNALRSRGGKLIGVGASVLLIGSFAQQAVAATGSEALVKVATVGPAAAAAGYVGMGIFRVWSDSRRRSART